MTNQQIVLLEAVRLMEAGVIAGSGEYVTVPTADGGEKVLEMPEALHTFESWKSAGRIVRKGEHAVARFSIWKKCKDRTVTEPDGTEVIKPGRMILKEACFFTYKQTEPVRA